MNVPEFLIRRLRKEVDMIFAAARVLPEDKLDWKPAPGARSALDQLQEVAFSVDAFWDAHAQRKMEMTPTFMAEFELQKSKLTTLDALEAKTRESHERLYAFIETVEPEQWTERVEMPFPGEFDLAYILSYYLWNGAYHEGQINDIGSLLKQDAGA